MLTIERNDKAESVEIFCDDEGLDALLKQLHILKSTGGHVHLMTPSWAGQDLTEKQQGDGTVLVNHLRIVLAPHDR